jgi:hypothetical protein
VAGSAMRFLMATGIIMCMVALFMMVEGAYSRNLVRMTRSKGIAWQEDCDGVYPHQSLPYNSTVNDKSVQGFGSRQWRHPPTHPPTHKLHHPRTHPENQGRVARAFHDGYNDSPTLTARCRPRLEAKHPWQPASRENLISGPAQAEFDRFEFFTGVEGCDDETWWCTGGGCRRVGNISEERCCRNCQPEEVVTAPQTWHSKPQKHCHSILAVFA